MLGGCAVGGQELPALDNKSGQCKMLEWECGTGRYGRWMWATMNLETAFNRFDEQTFGLVPVWRQCHHQPHLACPLSLRINFGRGSVDEWHCASHAETGLTSHAGILLPVPQQPLRVWPSAARVGGEIERYRVAGPDMWASTITRRSALFTSTF